ncbi:carbohydrate kinase family protein [Thiohalophilus sp.]|uniref:carbohydrate kinase family protein n=1 Tax=Thiohalophilus sp. TaxID=3028392 RepID=UPI002ACE73B5|nr:carbohydrate kinase family protein [Thiohalophilus sp.]MDZ7803861.1 carbohydrate kinase family protein [Thiohalophilus sp.]
MSALICGSFAYDTIMVFPDQFKNHILPDKVHILNVSFLVPEMRREFGGCAGNIAYNLKLLGGDPLPMGTVGTDFAPYAEWMDKNGISRKHIKEVNSYTGQAFITTDKDDNQITAFHPGAMGFSHENRVQDADGVKVGLVAPDGRDGMIQHAEQFAEQGIPFIFDPGQGLPMFGGDELMDFAEKASYIALNDYEAQLFEERTGKSPHELAEMVDALIITRGGEGSQIYTKQHRHEIPTAPVKGINDPTGCGDAYRAGILYGLLNDMDWETTGRIASLMGAIKVESTGPQNHSFTMDEFKKRYKESFDMSF